MQTFLPYADFARSARVLDTKRLGKQRIEARTILKALRGKAKGWRNHPAVRMWAGHESALKCYHNAVVAEWRRRGHKDSHGEFFVVSCGPMPPWLGKPGFHRSHRSNLLRKDRKHYSRFGWRVRPGLPYIWPR